MTRGKALQSNKEHTMLGKRHWFWLAAVIAVLVGGSRASADGTHGNDTLVMSTVVIDEGVEGLATLDTITGELRVFVLNPKAGKFTLGGKRNLLADLKIEKGRKVSLLMVSGVTRFAGAAAPGAVAAPGVIYIMDGNTGKFIGYGLTYPPGALAAAAEAEIVITPLDANTARTVKISP
jgi:hypothetical protein